MMALLESAEFWTSLAFVLVVVLASSPAFKGLRKWGKKQADFVLSAEQEAEQLFKKAKDLRETYNQSYQNRFQERKKAQQEADKKIAFLEQEIQTKTQEKIHHKKMEVAIRIQNIQENEQQNLKSKLMTRVITQAEEELLKAPQTEEMGQLTDQVCQTLEEFKSVLN